MAAARRRVGRAGVGSVRKRESKAVQGGSRGDDHVRRRPVEAAEDEKAYECAVLAPQGQGERDPVAAELDAVVHDQLLARFRLAEEPAREL
ncbi:MAG: hypothetical protein H0V79_05510 [Actinobacteria bacterium]|nr:hypothetical protein [Actinomycetota bacterium]